MNWIVELEYDIAWRDNIVHETSKNVPRKRVFHGKTVSKSL